MLTTSVRPGLWTQPDCDLQVMAQLPRELAFAVVAGTLSRHRDEMAQNLREAGGSAADAAAVLASLPDLSGVASRLRHPRPDRRPRGRTLSRLAWALRRARVFLEAFAPPTCADDPVLEDRAFDLMAKVAFLIDIVDDWRSPGAAPSEARKTG